MAAPVIISNDPTDGTIPVNEPPDPLAPPGSVTNPRGTPTPDTPVLPPAPGTTPTPTPTPTPNPPPPPSPYPPGSVPWWYQTVPSYDQALTMPGIQFAIKEAADQIQRSAAARGTLLTGGTLKDLADYTTGTALAQGYIPLANLYDLYNQHNFQNTYQTGTLLGAGSGSGIKPA